MSNKFKPLLETNLAEVRVQIDAALDKSMRDPDGVVLVVVSKRQPLGAVQAAYDCGVRHFGENLIQEGIPKVRAMAEDITWHFIGHLQKNKIRKAIKYFRYIHSIDSLSLLNRVDAIAAEERICPKILLQVNYLQDAAKQGLHPEEVAPVLETALDLKNVECVGLMGIPPAGLSEAQARAYFEGMATMRDSLRDQHPHWPGLLSLGMSSDYGLAIECGANFIRLGTTLFGART